MNRILRAVAVVGVCAGLMGPAVPVEAQRGKPPKAVACDSSPEAAVDCFVVNAVKTGLADVPEGMTMDEFRAWGVSVAGMLSQPGASVLAFGLASAVAEAMPPVSLNGVDSDASAQTAAVDAIVKSAIASRMLVLPEDVSGADAARLVRRMAESFSGYNGPSLNSGTVLRVLDAIVVDATDSTGHADWSKVNANIAKLVDSLIAIGLLTVPAGTTAGEIKLFAQDTALAIYNYKLATGQPRLLAAN
jgi:hypothetical protein